MAPRYPIYAWVLKERDHLSSGRISTQSVKLGVPSEESYQQCKNNVQAQVIGKGNMHLSGAHSNKSNPSYKLHKQGENVQPGRVAGMLALEAARRDPRIKIRQGNSGKF